MGETAGRFRLFHCALAGAQDIATRRIVAPRGGRVKQSDCCTNRSDARVLLLSQRRWNRQFYMPLTYEFEDVIDSVDRVDILTPDFQWNSRLSKFFYKGTNYVRSHLSLRHAPAISSLEIERDYDLFFCFLNFAYEVPEFKQLKNLRRRCKRAACIFTELWTSHVEQHRRSLEVLDDLGFDCIFPHHSSCLPALQQLLRTPSYCLPLAVDCLRFTPYPRFPARTIDCYSMGRRSPFTHQTLLDLAAKEGFFYVYDTAARGALIDWKEHRALLANTIARSRYFISYKPALRTDVVIGKDECIATRTFEGAAGGTVMLGIPPDCPEYSEYFDWPDATIQIPYNCGNIGEVIAELESDPERLARVRRNNMVQSLLRHDWVYRWEFILRALNMQPTSQLRSRQEKLQSIAAATQTRAGGIEDELRREFA
jgi:hypothetical protein